MVAATTAAGKKETPSEIISFCFNTAANRLGLDHGIAAILAGAARHVRVELPIRMDNGTFRVFEGYRKQHTDVRGPFIGGLRLRADQTAEDLEAFSRHKSLQCAIANVPFGGAMGGIVCDPGTLSKKELEALVRKYTSRVHRLMGPYRDVHAPDVGSDSQMMGWMLDEYSHVHEYSPACVVGKAMEMGGVPLSEETLSRGVIAVLSEVVPDCEFDARGGRVAIHGLGDAAARMALALSRAGWLIVALSDGQSAIHKPDGLNVDALIDHLQRRGRLAEFTPAEQIAVSDVLECDCDVLIPASLECVLHAGNARQVRADFVVEAASLPTTVAADAILREKNIELIPDLVTATGPLAAAHLEWNQNIQQVYCEEQRVIRELDHSMVRAYLSVKERATQDGTSLREAAYCLAIERVARAEKLRLT